MPPKQRFTPDDIIEAAFNVVRKNGWEGLSARAIAKELDCSTGPIYSYLESMKNLEEEVVKKAMALIYSYLSTPRTGDPWLDQALGHVLFAVREKHLFRGVYDEKYLPLTRNVSPKVWSDLREQLDGYELFQGLSEEQISLIRMARWFFGHGLSHLANVNWFTVDEENNIVIGEKGKEKIINLVDLMRMADLAIFKGFKEFERIDDKPPENDG
ncbi:TetR/AcrR family transcriptional regulator [Thermodesulfobacteriota bacterium]